MHTSSRSKSKYDLITYREEFVENERKILPFLVLGSLPVIACGVWFIMINQNGGWGLTLLSILFLLTSLVFLAWEPLLMFNDQGIRIRSNPLLTSFTLQWNEITEITPYKLKGNPYISFVLSPTYLETFLRRQFPLNKKLLERKLNRNHPALLLRADYLPFSTSTFFASIQEHCPKQIQQHSIRFGEIPKFDESLDE